MVRRANDNLAMRRLLMDQWTQWAFAMLSFVVTLLMPFVISRTYMPLPIALMGYTFAIYARRPVIGVMSLRCTLALRYARNVLLWTAVVMVVILLVYHGILFPEYAAKANFSAEIPFITSLILVPVMTVMAAWYLIVLPNSRGCRHCRTRLGCNVVSRVYERENTYRFRLLLIVSLMINLVTVWYYYNYYINYNFNSPDFFFFVVMPCVVMVLLLVAGLLRSANVLRALSPLGVETANRGPVARCIIVQGDQALLVPNHIGLWDTPYTIDDDDDEDMKAEFARLSGITDVEIKSLYVSPSSEMGPQVRHMAVYISEDSDYAAPAHAEWFTIDRLTKVLNMGQLAPELSSEIYRVYTIAMAWKTYTIEGLRKYPIKNYHPNFRLRDMREWDVDFNDMRWLWVARNNQDMPFYRLRRWWQRTINQDKTL